VLSNINKRLQLDRPLTEADVIAERCGVRPLAVEAGGGSSDWLQLSRKHVVEVDREKAHVSVFGGKLTDCLNVGEEICAHVRRLGVEVPYPERRWYGEPGEEVRHAFLHQARQLDLDGLTSPRSSEKLSARLWRRYGAQAIGLLADIRSDPRMAEVLIEGAEYLRCEIVLAARHEMITKLEDFLRRRSKISLVIRQSDLAKAPGLREACRILFGDEADRRYEEYFREHGAPAGHVEAKAPALAQQQQQQQAAS
jgi:glycerol-3-phosphate dehydrogenase